MRRLICAVATPCLLMAVHHYFQPRGRSEAATDPRTKSEFTGRTHTNADPPAP
jgi:hypothetical protein